MRALDHGYVDLDHGYVDLEGVAKVGHFWGVSESVFRSQ